MNPKSAGEFLSLIKKGERLLGLDIGEKTIGLSLSDKNLTIASPLKTIKRSRFFRDMAALKVIFAEHEIGGLVAGLPINMDGSEGKKCQSVRQFIRNLQKEVEIPAFFWDERLSTVAVTRTMLEADLSRSRRAELADKLAASYILQGMLDSK